MPNVRARLVGKEFRTDDNPDNFAATPPLEALRVVVSRAAIHGNEHYGVMINDVARAYFNAKIDRLLCCELPEEDEVEGEDLVGRLELCLYGIRDAARGWQECLAEHLVQLGFRRGTSRQLVILSSISWSFDIY